MERGTVRRHGTIAGLTQKGRAMQHALPSTPSLRRLGLAGLALVSALLVSGCGYNDFQSLDEQVKAAWSEVLNQYQRRADLVPNIVATVKGEAAFEQDTLTKVIEARSKATSIQATPELINDPEAFQKFQQAQGELSGALSRLMVVSEQYPSLRANQAFQDLRVTLEGTENRITVARNRYVKAVQDYNVKVRSVPTNFTAMIFGYKTKANFTVQNEAQISVPPTVDFSKPASASR
jgi:LemA protein